MDPDPYRDTDKTCLGGSMHCPSASSLRTVSDITEFKNKSTAHSTID